MGKNAPFGHPGAPDRLRLWWHGTSKTTRSNALLFLVVGTISAALVWAGVSRDARPRPQGLATASRPGPTVPPTLATIPTPLDLRAAGTGATPSALTDPAATTTSSAVPGAVPPSSTPPAPTPTTSPPSPSVTASPTSPAPTVPNEEVVFTTVPDPPDSTVPSVPSSTVPTTSPPTSTPPVTSPPPTSAPPTTAATLLPPLPLPPLLGR